MDSIVVFPKAFSCYKASSEKVYGSICISPSKTILLVKGRKSKKWSFPKGHKHRGETYIECAVRETFEEAGICLDALVPIGYQRLSVGEYYFYDMEDEIQPEIQDSREITEAKWMSIEDIRNSPCNVDVNNFLTRLRRDSGFFRRYCST
jgi:8-oxo-dGTP pyrophosphatase MutT (NUDIX family)